ncbi:Glucosyltransferase-like protein [Serendipita sp. 401]|nr:Glucosyltransferase-like protein [Serendipita sp. 401]KAG9056262.1 Glucosyltransferase-like protein [Serendipita sp. 407]
MSQNGSIRQRRTSTLNNDGVLFPGGRSSPIPRPTSLASVRSTNYSETDHSEILSPTPRRHYLIQRQSSQWLQSGGGISPSTSRPSSPLNPNHPTGGFRRHKPSLSFSSLAGNSKQKGAKVSGLNDSLARRWVRWMHKNKLKGWVLPIQILLALWVKWAVGLGSYSGENTPPMYGDYEAQRHWLEITYHLPVRMWYKYDLQYWGLDYPPLTAYVSWIFGYIANKINPAWVALDSSRGIELPNSKIYMRATVLVCDLLIYLPALFYFATKSSLLRHRSIRARHVAFFTLLLQPALILIDSGHFQYNSVMLGLTCQAFNYFLEGQDLLGAICFVASLGFKQMALYYSPAVFSYLLGKCLLLGWKEGSAHLIRIGLVTVLSFIVLFLPFLYPSFPENLLPPIQRIFPFARGLFEDKVANFWCTSNVVFKWNRHFSASLLPKLATGLTAVAFMPTMWALLSPGIKGFGSMASLYHTEASVDGTENKKSRRPAPTVSLLAHSLFQCSLSFFLFSFQVHEKTILVPLLPVSLLMITSAPTVEGSDWEWGVLLNNVGCFSMWPLLRRDGLSVQYVSLLALWNYAIGHNPFRQKSLQALTLAVYSAIFVLHISELVISPPARYPDIFPVLNTLISGGVFGLAWLWSLKRLVELSWAMGSLGTQRSSAPSSLRMNSLSNGTRTKPLAVQEVFSSSIYGDNSATGGNGHNSQRHSVSPASSMVRRRNTSVLPPTREEGPSTASVVDLNEPSM